MATNGRKIVVERKMHETPFFIDSRTNKYSGNREIQINETYQKGDMTEPTYGRKNVGINVIDIPAVVAALVELYEEETGNDLISELSSI